MRQLPDTSKVVNMRLLNCEDVVRAVAWRRWVPWGLTVDRRRLGFYEQLMQVLHNDPCTKVRMYPRHQV